MSKNIVYYFSGTGNSLQAAKEIAESIPNCEIRAMGEKDVLISENEYERIGFVYPCYFQGVPIKVAQFISELDLSKNKSAYYFAVATYGGLALNAVSQVKDLLGVKNITLDYGAEVKMFSNYIVMYKMASNREEKAKQASRYLVQIKENIKNKIRSKTKKSSKIVNKYYRLQTKKVPDMDRGFTVSSACISCGMCKEICPVKNISIVNGKPEFHHQCEQCTACIQFCPKEAINYKDLTQNRGRYTNPAVSFQELRDKNKGL